VKSFQPSKAEVARKRGTLCQKINFYLC